jgi:hypothetical protein
MSWSKIHTRNDGRSEPGFYRRLLNGECTASCHHSVQSTRTGKPFRSEISRKINYCIVQKLIKKRYGLKTLRCQIDITNRQHSTLLNAFAVTGKFKHFDGFIQKMNIITTVNFGNKSIRIDLKTFQIKVISKPKVCISQVT